jgi:hypothetical protein
MYRLTGVSTQDIQQHRKQYKQWKARDNVLCCISRMDSAYRVLVERDGSIRNSVASNAFLALYPEDAQLIYQAAAHVDGEGKLGNGISRHIFSYLPNTLEGQALDDVNEEEEDDRGYHDW